MVSIRDSKNCEPRKEMEKYDLNDLPIELLREAKVNGFSDEQISRITNHGDEEDVYQKEKLPASPEFIRW